jgi:hypothetical protein
LLLTRDTHRYLQLRLRSLDDAVGSQQELGPEQMQGRYISLLLGLGRESKRFSDHLHSFCPVSGQQAIDSRHANAGSRAAFRL